MSSLVSAAHPQSIMAGATFYYADADDPEDLLDYLRVGTGPRFGPGR